MTAPPLPPELRARVLASVAKTPAPPAAWPRRVLVSGAVGAVWLGAAYAWLGLRMDWSELPLVYSAGTLVALALSASVLSVAALARGREMLGLPVRFLLAAISLVPLGVLVWVSLVRGHGPSTVMFPSIGASLARGSACDFISLGLAIPLTALLLRLKRDALVGAPILGGASIGAAAATWAHVVVHAHCPVGNLSHALVGHLLPIVPVMLVGALAAVRLVRLR